MKNYGNVKLAQELRIKQTDAESVLWSRLRNSRLNNIKFRRQYPLGIYIVDFFSSEHRLIVEVDGGQHNEPTEISKDKRRAEWLEARGYRILRIWNNDVWQNIDGVLTEILNCCQNSHPHP